MYIWFVFKSAVYILLFWKKFVLTDPNTGPPSTGTKPVELNIKSDTSSTDKFVYKTEGNYITYTTKDDYEFKLVKEDGATVWEASDDNFSNRVEVDIMGEKSAVTIYLDDDETLIFFREASGKPWTEIDRSVITPKSINVDYPHNSHFYTNTLEGSIRTFEAKFGFAFNGANKYINNVKFELWKTTNESEFSTKVVNEGNKVTVHFADGTSKVIEKGSDGKWPGQASEPQSSSSADKSAKINGVDINLKSDTKSTRKFDYLKIGKIVTYSAKDNNRFKQVKDDNVLVWKESDATKFASKLEVDLMNNDSKAVTIIWGVKNTKVFMKAGKDKPWNAIDTSKVNTKSVNIIYPHESFFYSNKLSNGVRTFEAKHGFMFNQVRSFVNKVWVDIWKTDEPDQYSGKVVAESDKVTIYIGREGASKIFNKVADDKWVEQTSDSKADSPDDSTIIVDSVNEFDVLSSDQPQADDHSDEDILLLDDQPGQAQQSASDSPAIDPAANLVPSLTPRSQPPVLSSSPKTALHHLICHSLPAVSILADLDNGLHVSDFKFVQMGMWSSTYGAVNLDVPLLARSLFALVYTDDGWATQYIDSINSFSSSHSPQTNQAR